MEELFINFILVVLFNGVEIYLSDILKQLYSNCYFKCVWDVIERLCGFCSFMISGLWQKLFEWNSLRIVGVYFEEVDFLVN